MRRKIHKKASIGKVVTGIVVESAVGATVGWLTGPASGEEVSSDRVETIGKPSAI